MQKIFDLLDVIRLRNYFLTSKSIFSLQDFINGYMVFGKYGIHENTDDLIYNENDLNFNEFLYWIQKTPFIPVSPGPYFADFLLKESNGDVSKAFDLFYELLDEFKKIKAGGRGVI